MLPHPTCLEFRSESVARFPLYTAHDSNRRHRGENRGTSPLIKIVRRILIGTTYLSHNYERNTLLRGILILESSRGKGHHDLRISFRGISGYDIRDVWPLLHKPLAFRNHFTPWWRFTKLSICLKRVFERHEKDTASLEPIAKYRTLFLIQFWKILRVLPNLH